MEERSSSRCLTYSVAVFRFWAAIGRTVGAALRGRPWFKAGSPNPWPSLLESVSKPRAATEGRPYSTFDVMKLILLVLCVTVCAHAQSLTPPEEKSKPVIIPKFDKPPTIDGKLDEEVWQKAAVLKDFYQIQPGDNTPPSKPTEVLIGFDPKFSVRTSAFSSAPIPTSTTALFVTTLILIRRRRSSPITFIISPTSITTGRAGCTYGNQRASPRCSCRATAMRAYGGSRVMSGCSIMSLDQQGKLNRAIRFRWQTNVRSTARAMSVRQTSSIFRSMQVRVTARGFNSTGR